jgi:hypothetical protein
VDLRNYFPSHLPHLSLRVSCRFDLLGVVIAADGRQNAAMKTKGGSRSAGSDFVGVAKKENRPRMAPAGTGTQARRANRFLVHALQLRAQKKTP